MSIQYCELELEDDLFQPNPARNPLFPCTAYYTDIVHHLGGELPWHWHEEVEILIVKKGAVQLFTPTEQLLITEGCGCFINSNVLHRGLMVANEQAVLHSLVFSPSLIYGKETDIFYHQYVKPLIQSTALSVIYLNEKTDWAKEVLDHIEAAYDTYEKDDFGLELSVRNHLNEIWLLLLRHHREKLTTGENDMQNERLKTMLQYIHDHYPQPITLAHIANAANVSTRECLRTFKQSIDTTPMQYLLAWRLRAGARMLVVDNESIANICTKVGIDSPSYFTKKFKEHFLLTPTAYKRKHQ